MEYELIDYIYDLFFGLLTVGWVFLFHYFINFVKIKESWKRLIGALILPGLCWYLLVVMIFILGRFYLSDWFGMLILLNGINVIVTSIMGLMLVKSMPEKYLNGLSYLIFLTIISLTFCFFELFCL